MRVDNKTRTLGHRMTITGNADLIAEPTIGQLRAALEKMKRNGNVNRNIVRGEIVRRHNGGDAYDVPTVIHLDHMVNGGYDTTFTTYAERFGCVIRYNTSTVEKKIRPTLRSEFAVIDKLVEESDESAISRHPEYTDLPSADFAKVLLVMYGRERAQGKLAAIFDEFTMPKAERMYFFAVGVCLDSAIDSIESTTVIREYVTSAMASTRRTLATDLAEDRG